MVNSHDLHQKDITSIELQGGANMIVLTGGKDGKLNFHNNSNILDHIKAWNVGDDGKFVCLASGISTTAIYSLVLAGEK